MKTSLKEGVQKKVSKDQNNIINGQPQMEKRDEDLNKLIHNCKDIESLEIAFTVKDVDIIKEEYVKPGMNGYYCITCNQGTKPNFENKSYEVFTDLGPQVWSAAPEVQSYAEELDCNPCS